MSSQTSNQLNHVILLLDKAAVLVWNDDRQTEQKLPVGATVFQLTDDRNFSDDLEYDWRSFQHVYSSNRPLSDYAGINDRFPVVYHLCYGKDWVVPTTITGALQTIIRAHDRDFVMVSLERTLEPLYSSIKNQILQLTTKENTMSDQQYVNYYRHCSEHWEDTSDSMHNDRCPKCNKEIEPYESKAVEAVADPTPKVHLLFHSAKVKQWTNSNDVLIANAVQFLKDTGSYIVSLADEGMTTDENQLQWELFHNLILGWQERGYRKDRWILIMDSGTDGFQDLARTISGNTVSFIYNYLGVENNSQLHASSIPAFHERPIALYHTIQKYLSTGYNQQPQQTENTMNTKDQQSLLVRAAAALETPADLSDQDRKELIEDLRHQAEIHPTKLKEEMLQCLSEAVDYINEPGRATPSFTSQVLNNLKALQAYLTEWWHPSGEVHVAPPQADMAKLFTQGVEEVQKIFDMLDTKNRQRFNDLRGSIENGVHSIKSGFGDASRQLERTLLTREQLQGIAVQAADDIINQASDRITTKVEELLNASHPDDDHPQRTPFHQPFPGADIPFGHGGQPFGFPNPMMPPSGQAPYGRYGNPPQPFGYPTGSGYFGQPNVGSPFDPVMFNGVFLIHVENPFAAQIMENNRQVWREAFPNAIFRVVCHQQPESSAAMSIIENAIIAAKQSASLHGQLHHAVMTLTDRVPTSVSFAMETISLLSARRARYTSIVTRSVLEVFNLRSQIGMTLNTPRPRA